MLALPSKDYETTFCPLCGSSIDNIEFEYLANSMTLPLYGCKTCEFSFIRPMPLEILENRKMETIEDAELFSPLFKVLHESLVLGREARSLRRICNKTQIDLLDIGCGSGWSSDFWRRKGAIVEAVEPSLARCEYARRQYGLTVHNCYVEELNLPGKFDVVVLRHILEHLEHPAEIVNSVRNLLKDDGVILLVVPNINCIGRKLFGRHWEWVLPWHCNFFTPKSIVKLTELCGFEAVATYQSPSPLYYGESLGRVLHFPVLEGFFARYRLAGLPVALPLALLGVLSGLGDNVTVVARKSVKA